MTQSTVETEGNAPGRTIGILQPGYLPWLGFFEQLSQVDLFVLYDDVEYSKGTWRNRNRIKTVDGPQWLTVPVRLKGKGRPLINAVEICPGTSWRDKHIRAIEQNYGRTPFFEHYARELFEILGRHWQFLADLDIALIRWLAAKLAIETPMRLSSEVGIGGARTGRLIDMISYLDGQVFYEGAAGRNYIDVTEFEQAGIRVVFQDYQHPTYPQLHGDFVSHLSVVDLLFNCGPDSRNILTGASR